jgi:cytoskeletal protein CcmA (bactofilin family)
MAAKNGTANCTIGEGSVFEGRFYVRGSVQIDGKFQGDIKTDDELFVGPTGRVKTDIAARKVTVAGTLIGNIVATEEVHLIGNGKVLGNISTPKLTVDPGVVTSGQLTITTPGQPEVAAAVAESFGVDADEAFKEITSTARRTRKSAATEPASK